MLNHFQIKDSESFVGKTGMRAEQDKLGKLWAIKVLIEDRLLLQGLTKQYICKFEELLQEFSG